MTLNLIFIIIFFLAALRLNLSIMQLLCVQTEVTKEIWVSRSDKYYVQNKSNTKHNNTRLLMAKSLSILYIYKVHVYLHLSISMLRNGPIIMNIFNTNNHVTG